MDSIPLQLQAEFETLLRNRSVPAGVHPQYKKWLRFYLDFCRKYRFSETERKSLEHFLRKLQEKKQTEKTLKTYKTWVRHFQTFTKSPDPKSLSADDVKAFRTFLAVTKKVSASTQNQAFNALLFFCRHVLSREFGKVEGVVRAKRRSSFRCYCPGMRWIKS